MKCVGFDNPPCVRCAKVGRECRPQQYTRNRSVSRQVEENLAPKPASHDVIESLPSKDARAWSPNGSSLPGEGTPVWPSNDSSLPSIYTTPPFMSVIQETKPSDSTSAVSIKRWRIEPPPPEEPLFNRDMAQLIKLEVEILL